MVAFRVRPRQLRPPRPHSGALIGRGHQKSHAIATLAAQSGALGGIGHQKSHAVANLFYARGHQKSHARATPAILGQGRQKSHAIATLGGGGGGFANGYGYRALVEIAPQPDLSGTVANLVLRLTADVLAATQLKTVANGGVVQSASGWDIRLEPYGAAVGAGKLDHQFVTPYSPTAGAVDLRFRVVVPGATPSWDVTTPYRLWLYAGKAGLVAREENAVGLWQGATAAVRMSDGADLTGGGKPFAAGGAAIVATTLAGMPAGTFAGTSNLSRSLSAGEVGLQGLAECSSEFVFRLTSPVPATADGNLDRVGGTALSVRKNARLSTWIFTTLEYQGGANWFSAGAQNNCDAATADNVADATLTHLWCLRKSGLDPELWRGETQLTTTTNNPATSGIVNVLAGDVWELGAGSGARADTTPGTYALYVLWPVKLSAAFVAMRHRSEVECRSVAGMGGFDAFGDTDASPVAAPLRATNAGAQQDYDVVPGCFDPDGDPITLASVGDSSHAGDTTSLTGGKVRFKPQPGWAGGTAEVPFAIGDGRGKAGSSRLWLAVRRPIVAVGNEGLAPPFPTSTATIKGPVAASAIQATYNALTASEIAGGVTILVTPGGTLSGGLTLNRSGAKGTGADDFHPQFPIIIRPGTLSGGLIVDPAISPSVTITGTVTISGSYNWLRGSRVGWAVVGSQANHPAGCRFNRCAATLTGNISDYGTSTSVDWCEIGNVAGVLLPRYAQFGCRTPFTYRTWLHNGVGTASGNGTMEMIGTGDLADTVVCGGLQLECLLGPSGDISEGWESKSAGNVQRRCAIVGTAAQSLRAIVRHGANCEIDTLYCGPHSYAGFRGGPHVFADSTNVDSAPPYWGPFTGNCTYAEWQAFALARQQAGKYPRGENVTMHRIGNPIIGGSPSGTPDHPPVGTALLSCTGATTRRDGATVTTGTSTRPLPTKAARDWPVPTGAASDLIGPMGTYNAAD